ncbi:Protein of unknown function DUF2149 [Ammonifex degensii KC4]|uniref:DUF2149 domain-containing protein n=1 Tax=Ammonifex degensii (strain DSM 10501 / KC4) TaxID=429009 RepID=C9R8V4_AMMDK|nr:DUF2149 domain-containing protein [Ammonifex degensii]ACX52733.1 Protein of unknown function DUF2149 [Ammonifex degensii KC4]
MLQAAGDVNPLEGAINIVDAMLVFACGLMLALALYWNINLAHKGERVDIRLGRDVSQLPEVRHDLIETRGEGKMYEKVGTVFKDPETGRMFMITK